MATRTDGAQSALEAKLNRALARNARYEGQIASLTQQLTDRARHREYTAAGISHLTPRALRAVEREHQGERTADALRGTAVECGFIDPPAPPSRPSPEAIAAELIRRHDLARSQLPAEPPPQTWDEKVAACRTREELDSLIAQEGHRHGLIPDEDVPPTTTMLGYWQRDFSKYGRPAQNRTPA